MHTTIDRTAAVPGALWLGLTALVHDYDGRPRDLIVERMGLPFSRFRALRRLELQPLRQRELAERMGIDAPAASVIIADLVGHGYARRESDPDDARCKVVTITEAGIRMMGEVRAIPDLAPDVFDRLAPDQREQLARILDTLRAVRS